MPPQYFHHETDQSIRGDICSYGRVDARRVMSADDRNGQVSRTRVDTNGSTGSSLVYSTNGRVRDVVTLKKDRIKDGKLFLRTAKTGTDVFCPLLVIVVEALNQIGSKIPYYFWSGQSKPKSAVGNYQRALKALFELAEVPRVHAHFFRHTFATEMLLAGNSLEAVAALLGHTSTKGAATVIRSKDGKKLEEAVKNSWARLGSQATVETQNR